MGYVDSKGPCDVGPSELGVRGAARQRGAWYRTVLTAKLGPCETEDQTDPVVVLLLSFYNVLYYTINARRGNSISAKCFGCSGNAVLKK